MISLFRCLRAKHVFTGPIFLSVRGELERTQRVALARVAHLPSALLVRNGSPTQKLFSNLLKDRCADEVFFPTRISADMKALSHRKVCIALDIVGGDSNLTPVWKGLG